jgi:ribonucleoside-triphosphate reductase
MEVAAQAHLEKRVFLEKLLALGEKGPLAALATRAGSSPFLKLSWTTHAIGVVGLNELCRAVLDCEIHDSPESLDFSLKVLRHLKHECERLSSKHRVRFLLSGLPADSAATRFARLDLRFFGVAARAITSGETASDTAYYTGGFKTSSRNPLSLRDEIKTEGALHAVGVNNVATEVLLGGSSTPVEEIRDIVIEALSGTWSAGLVFCPEFTLCFDCGDHSHGLNERCAACGSDRVDGLAYAGDRYGYTSEWDAAKLRELNDRARR